MEDKDAAEQFVDHFLTDEPSKVMVAMKIRAMLDAPPELKAHIDYQKLGKALWQIGESFKGNDDKVVEGVDRIYSEFVKRI